MRLRHRLLSCTNRIIEIPYGWVGAYSCCSVLLFFPWAKEPCSDRHNTQGARSENYIDYCFYVSLSFIRSAQGLWVFHGRIFDIDRWIGIALVIANFKCIFLAFRNALKLIAKMVKPFDYTYWATFFWNNSAFRRGYAEWSATQWLLNIDFHGFDAVVCFNQVIKFLFFHSCPKPWCMKAEIKFG